jgi:hypothetical protein
VLLKAKLLFCQTFNCDFKNYFFKSYILKLLFLNHKPKEILNELLKSLNKFTNYRKID